MKDMKRNILDKLQRRTVNPYKGLHSYEETDKETFYGRHEETKTLSELIKYNFLSVVFGKAGIGKTSLLNAGVFPLLREEGFLPIPLRLNYSEEALSLKEQINDAILSQLEAHGIELKPQRGDEPMSPLTPEETLWEYFHRVIHFDPASKKPVTPVLMLDQFEEFFTLGKRYSDKQKEDLIDELYWLIEDQVPPSLEERISKGDKKRASFSSARPDVRLIIGLREDYLGHFMGLKSRIASIDRTTFRVIHLNGNQAKEIIRKPARIKNEKVIHDVLRLFYPDDSEEEKEIPFENLEVEPSILSLICFQIAEEKETGSFTKKDRHRILTRFYNSVMKKFPTEVEEFIEDRLLTGEGFRTLFRLGRDHPLKNDLLQLVNQRILRKVYRGEKEYIEIIHDVLVSIINEKKEKRLDKIRKREFRKQIERRYYRVAMGIISSVAIVLALVTGYALYQKGRADEQNIKARANRLTAEAQAELPRNNTRAMRIAEAAFALALPNPPARAYEVLSKVGYSSFRMPFYIAILKHKDAIYTSLYSPDGKYILTASEDGTAKLWDQDGKMQTELKHGARVLSAAFSPDGQRILTASWDKRVRVWNLEGKLLKELTHKGIVSSAYFSPDGHMILTASRDGRAALWNPEGKLLKEIIQKGALSSAVFSPDGRLILTVSWDKRVKLWNLEGKLLFERKHKRTVSSARFSPEGSKILTASWDKHAKLWSLEGRLLADFKHNGPVSSAAFSPDGRRILTASRDAVANVWDIKGNLLVNLEHNAVVSSAMFSPEGGRILTSCEDGTAKVWSLEGIPLANLLKHHEVVSYAGFSPDGRQVLTASKDGTARIWDLDSNILIDLNKHKAAVNTAVFSPDGNKILTTSQDKTAGIWDLEGKLQVSLKHSDVVIFGVFSPDGKRVVTASENGSIKVWNLQGKALLERTLHAEPILSAVFSSDGDAILTSSSDSFAMLYSIPKKKVLANFAGHTNAVISAVFSPDGRLVLTASRDGTAKIWNLAGELLTDLNKHEGPVSSAVFSSDGKRILTASDDGTVKLWNPKGEVLRDLIKYRGPVLSAFFSPDGRRIITTSEENSAKLWDLNGNLLSDLSIHKGIVSYAAFSPDCKRILTASQDGTAKIWLTPETIYEWLKTAKIPPLSNEDKIKLEIPPDTK